MFFIPKSENYSGIATSDLELIVLIYKHPIEVCDRLLMESLNSYAEKINYDFKGLKIKKPFYIFLQNLLYYTKEEIPCYNLYEMKRAEITLLFQIFYTKEEQAMFFYHAIGSNLKFRNMVMDNYLKVKTAEELGSACGYKKYTFQRLFKKHFGQTPYKWMQQEVSKHIYEKLIDKEVPLKVIVDEFGFSSSGHFTNYCKRLFGATPIQIRNSYLELNE
jgi:AraC-like DNA-binding protein